MCMIASLRSPCERELGNRLIHCSSVNRLISTGFASFVSPHVVLPSWSNAPPKSDFSFCSSSAFR